MKTRKIPLRMCVGCREMKEKKTLIRIVKNAEGAISVDINTKGLKPGQYGREIVIITNDYINPVKRVKLLFTVE